MISRIKGTLIEKQAPAILIEVQGLGYEVQVPMSTFYQLPELNQPVTLHTHFVVREDAQILYGFHDQAHRSLFKQVIKVSGVGPKIGLAILSGLSANELLMCLQNNDINQLTKVPGVGKRTAERLMVEMRGSLDESLFTNASDNASNNSNTMQQEAISALIALGYRAQDASRVISKLLEKAQSSEELIRLALVESQA